MGGLAEGGPRACGPSPAVDNNSRQNVEYCEKREREPACACGVPSPIARQSRSQVASDAPKAESPESSSLLFPVPLFAPMDFTDEFSYEPLIELAANHCFSPNVAATSSPIPIDQG